MKINIEHGGSPSTDVPLGVFTFEDQLGEIPTGLEEDSCIKMIYKRMVAGGEITGKSGEAPYSVTCTPEGPSRIYFIGLGDSRKTTMEDFRRAGALVNRRLRRFHMPEIDLLLPQFRSMTPLALKGNVQAFTEGFVLRNYDFSKYIEEVDEGVVEKIRFIEEDSNRLELLSEGVRLGKLFGNATNYCRDLANEPANVMTPAALAEKARKIADVSPRMTVEIMDENRISELGMGLIENVARASGNPPRVIALNYDSGQEGVPTVGLVGKGITFDSGGISIKRSEGMFEMKRDLSGGAAVLSVLNAVGRMELKINIIGLVVAAENMIGADALRPGDIIKSLSGKTVEVLNTDAEGRLVLADLLTYIQNRWKPDYILDIATLTGNISKALGRYISGILVNNDELFNKLNTAAKRSNEKIWRMPLEEHYRPHIKSRFADLKNISSKAPDSMVAGLFLQNFIEKGTPWAHLDIAGTETHHGEPSKYYVRGATGVGTRLILEFILEESRSPDALQWCYEERPS